MTHTFQSEHESTLTGHRFFLLFLFLLATLILYPYAEASRFGYYALRVLGSAAILLSVYAANFRRSLLIFAVLLAVPALFQHITLPKINANSFSMINTVLSFIFDVFIVVVLFRLVFARADVNSETVFGALCIYLLVGFIFASVYEAVATLQPNAFFLDPRTNLHAVPDRFDFIYYSFGTDLTGPFCTSRREREFTRRTAGYAHQEGQSRTDRDDTASDRSGNCERKAHPASLQGS